MTPIDWKHGEQWVAAGPGVRGGHHSLMTPIDWKHGESDLQRGVVRCHHSLMTPIDWKLNLSPSVILAIPVVTTR